MDNINNSQCIHNAQYNGRLIILTPIASYHRMISGKSYQNSITYRSCTRKCYDTSHPNLKEEYDAEKSRVTHPPIQQWRPKIAFPVGLIGVPYLYFLLLLLLK
jgi:hypothetical protein